MGKDIKAETVLEWLDTIKTAKKENDVKKNLTKCVNYTNKALAYHNSDTISFLCI